MFVNIIRSYRDIVAICDENLLGQKFEEGEFQLDVKENFYGKVKKTPEETSMIMDDMKKNDATFNIVGKDSIELAIQQGLIQRDDVKTIQGIKFALVLL